MDEEKPIEPEPEQQTEQLLTQLRRLLRVLEEMLEEGQTIPPGLVAKIAEVERLLSPE